MIVWQQWIRVLNSFIEKKTTTKEKRPTFSVWKNAQESIEEEKEFPFFFFKEKNGVNAKNCEAAYESGGNSIGLKVLTGRNGRVLGEGKKKIKIK